MSEPRMQSDDGVSVERVPVAAWERDLLLDTTGRPDLVILPQSIRDGIGVYRDSDLALFKALRQAGVSVGWAHSTSERTFASQYGAEIAIAIGFFVAQALGQEGVVEVARWLKARVQQALAAPRVDESRPTFVVEVDRLTIDGDRREIEGLRITGKDERIVDAVASLLQGKSGAG